MLKKIIIVAVFVAVIVTLVVRFNKPVLKAVNFVVSIPARLSGPIKASEFSNISEKACITPGKELIDRCMRFGGVLEINGGINGLGFAKPVIFGCFPKTHTTDEGSRCSSDRDCQGVCRELTGDLVPSVPTYFCSDYKQPSFRYFGELTSFRICEE
jgi:hypothetical protein